MPPIYSDATIQKAHERDHPESALRGRSSTDVAEQLLPGRWVRTKPDVLDHRQSSTALDMHRRQTRT